MLPAGAAGEEAAAALHQAERTSPAPCILSHGVSTLGIAELIWGIGLTITMLS